MICCRKSLITYWKCLQKWLYYAIFFSKKWQVSKGGRHGIQTNRKSDKFCGFQLGEPPARRDLAVSTSLKHNRSLTMMNKINTLISWKNIEALLLEYYKVGTSKEGADAYPPLMLLKCLLLQKCHRPGGLWLVEFSVRRGIARSGFPSGLEAYGLEGIPSDPELENQTCPVECMTLN